MFKKILPLILLLNVLTVNAQEPFYKSFSWENNPDFNKFKTDSNEDMMAFKDKVVNEFFFVDDGLSEFQLIHKILWLNSNDRIEEYNKIYLPYSSNSELMVSKARVVNPNGKVIELDESKILTSVNEETNQTYKFFAFEGVEIGSFIEYYFVVKKYPDYRGKRITLQSDYVKYNVELDVFAPKNLIFEFKSFNGLESVKNDTLVENKQHWQLQIDKIEKLEIEEHSAYVAEKQYVVYNLDKNTASNVTGISSYSNRSKGFYEYLYVELSKSEQSLLDDLIKKIDLKSASDEVSKLRKIENYLKSNFFLSEVNSEKLEVLNDVLKSNTANETGIMRLYIAIFKKLDIPFEVVLTTDRFETKFDNKFESGNFLTDYLFYFPNSEKFTSPIELQSRIGFPPYEFTDNYGLFIKEISLGNFKNAVGKIKYINAPTEKETIDEMFIKVNFDEDDFTVNTINIEKSYSGYYASYIQPFMNLMTEENANDLYDRIIKSIHENLEIVDKVVFNDKVELFGKEPFKIVTNVKSEVFTNKAGNKYLFKLGEIIGTQIEMYQEKERILPIEDDYQRSFLRKLEINIPEGYKITNLNDININHFFDKDGERLLMFHSYYEINSNLLTVYANEYYSLNRIDLENFEQYRKVVNAAADFNKIVLIMAQNADN